MPLSPGDRLGPYEILAPIGEGGMGEVYKSRDGRLDRVVAIKVSKTEFSERFEREARSVAALNHPNICTLHDVGPNYLVMEYVEGKPIAGPLPLEKAVEYAGQILDALDAAHRKGIAHRDLKPGNILVARQGIKLLDFGLAKTIPPKTTDADETAVMGLTRENTILGTPQYMAPEQIEGQGTDVRTDIFGFGLVFFEMLSGSKAFQGKSASQLMAAVLTSEPPSLNGLAPQAVERVLRRALAKDPEQRWQSARDVKLALAMAMEPVAQSQPTRRTPWYAWAAALMLLAGIGGVAMWRGHGGEAPPVPFQLSILPPEGAELPPLGSQGSEPEISPDGTAVIFGAGDKVWMRRLDSLQPQQVPGLTSRIYSAFWSPDGKSAGFLTGPPAAAMIRLNLADGAREQILAIPSPTRGATSNRDGTILFFSAGLQSVPFTGGKPQQVSTGPKYFPCFLPDGENFVFSIPLRELGNEDLPGGIYLGALRGGKLVAPVLLRANALGAHYVEAGGGDVLFVSGDDLFRQKLDLTERKLTGEPKLVLHGVGNDPGQAVADFSVSSNGILAWRPGRAPTSRLTWFDRQGRELGTLGPEIHSANAVQLSPDGRHVTVNRLLLDVTTGEQVNLDFRNFEWSPDGSAILVRSSGADAIEEHSLANLKEIKSVRQVPSTTHFNSWDVSADGTLLWDNDGSFLALRPGASVADAIRLPVPSGSRVSGEQLSPDGRWLLYWVASAGGVYVQPVTAGSLRQRIDPAGVSAVWRADGKEILFWRDSKIWSVRVEARGNQVATAAPQPLFSYVRPAGSIATTELIAVTRDGSRILVPKELPQPGPTNVIHVRTLPR